MSCRVISKGDYTRRQRGGSLAVKQYLIAEDGGRKLFLRFANESGEAVTAFSGEIVQFGEDGKFLARTPFSEEAVTILPGEESGPFRAIPVDAKCADVRVNLLRVRSHEYLYEFTPEGTAVRFVSREAEADRAAQLQRVREKQTSQTSATRKLTWALLFAALVVAFAVGAFSFTRHFGTKEDVPAAAVQIEEEL